jgi:CheY-like chemotaxis protein
LPKTLLAVDDSATMRKVLEITFAGEDFRVVSAEGPSGALSGLGEHPVAAVIDTSLAGEDGYALAKELRTRDSGLAVVLMASRYSPYDPNRARDAGVDDFIDKPFDTQALIDKVKKAVVARETSRPAQVTPAAAVTPSPATLSLGSGGGAPPRPQPAAPTPAPAVAGAAPGSPKAAWNTQRTNTLSFEAPPSTTGPAAAAQSPTLTRTAPSGSPVPSRPSAATQPAAQGAAPVPVASTLVPLQPPAAASPAGPGSRSFEAASSIANGQLAAQLDSLGLTPPQAQAILALSRELVERVVWEVVPQLAEAIIREEIARVMKED